MSCLDSPQIGGRYFFPRHVHFPDPDWFEVDGARLACRHYDTGSELTLLHFHGNGEVITDYFCDQDTGFFSLGVNLVFVEYRGYGQSTGRPGLVSMLGDGQAVLRSLKLPASRTIAFGRSIGSLFAVELAHREPDLAALALESGIADVSERLLVYSDLEAAGVSEQELRQAVNLHLNQREKLAGYTRPLLLLHTERDSLIGISHAERNLAASGSKQKRLVRFNSGDHNTIMAVNYHDYFEEVLSLLKSVRSDPG